MRETIIPVIDAHCHVFPDMIADKSKTAVGAFYDLPMYTSGTAAHLRAEREKIIAIGEQRFQIVRQLICSPAVVPKQTASINRFISQLVGEDDALTGFGTLHPDNSDFAEVLDSFAEHGLKGLKVHSDFQRFDIDEPAMYPVWEKTIALGMPVLFHMGDRKYDYSHPRRLRKLLGDMPDLLAVAAHMGGYSHWAEAYDVLEPSDRLYFDISSTLQFIEGDMLRRFLDKFGAEHFFFGSDFPMWDPASELERLVSFGFDSDVLQMLLHDNYTNFLHRYCEK